MPGKRLETLQKMLEQSPADSFLLYGLAHEYQNAGDLDNAIASYHRLFEVNPGYVAAYYHCGQAYEGAGQPDNAAATYDKGIEVARERNDTHALSELQAARDVLG